MPVLSRTADVFLLDLGADENRFHPAWLAAAHAAIDEVEVAAGPRALVTAARGKFWSNGLDLEWMGTDPEAVGGFVADVERLLARVLGLGVPTVAAVQGHCFAAGAMLSLCHDRVLMRGDRGFWCLPEVHIGIPFPPGMAALLQGRLAPAAAHEAMTTGQRYGGDAALAQGIVSRVLPEHELLPAAMAEATALAGNAGPTLEAIKRGMYAGALVALGGPA